MKKGEGIITLLVGTVSLIILATIIIRTFNIFGTADDSLYENMKTGLERLNKGEELYALKGNLKGYLIAQMYIPSENDGVFKSQGNYWTQDSRILQQQPELFKCHGKTCVCLLKQEIDFNWNYFDHYYSYFCARFPRVPKYGVDETVLPFSEQIYTLTGKLKSQTLELDFKEKSYNEQNYGFDCYSYFAEFSDPTAIESHYLEAENNWAILQELAGFTGKIIQLLDENKLTIEECTPLTTGTGRTEEIKTPLKKAGIEGVYYAPMMPRMQCGTIPVETKEGTNTYLIRYSGYSSTDLKKDAASTGAYEGTIPDTDKSKCNDKTNGYAEFSANLEKGGDYAITIRAGSVISSDAWLCTYLRKIGYEELEIPKVGLSTPSTNYDDDGECTIKNNGCEVNMPSQTQTPSFCGVIKPDSNCETFDDNYGIIVYIKYLTNPGWYRLGGIEWPVEYSETTGQAGTIKPELVEKEIVIPTTDYVTAIRIELEGNPLENFDVNCENDNWNTEYFTDSYMLIEELAVKKDGETINPGTGETKNYEETRILPILLMPRTSNKYSPLLMLSDKYGRIELTESELKIDNSADGPAYYYLDNIKIK